MPLLLARPSAQVIVGGQSGWQKISSTNLRARPRQLAAIMADATQRLLWIDTDAGVDDAQALIMALGHPSTQIVGISTVHGNTGLHNVNANVLRVLTACSADVPVYAGSAEPLVCDPWKASGAPYHGNDGMGDAPEVWPTSKHVTMSLQPGFAVTKLIECAAQHAGSLNVLALGPLTNLALAVKLDPELPKRIQRLVVMGGANGPGNMSPHAEFNFHCDPEAAKVVIQKFPGLVLVPRDLGISHSLPWPQFERVLAKTGSKAIFFAGISADSVRRSRRHEAGYMTHDPQAVVVAVEPSAVTASRRVHCDVEIQGSHLTRGMSVMDWEGHLLKEPNIELIEDINVAMLMDLLEKALD